ncbi:hypothetical protein GJ744_005044 [Endocarpon pusillum]|uniref:Invertebrate defensins family profile domain-containing protein n=1 Tax=Endocarpon pusillum TaxID=364733 RepID=A0A8H7A8X5_9EURO|nr:hypothetical protein GJ744_005044 [Endocarpon pusillum]
MQPKILLALLTTLLVTTTTAVPADFESPALDLEKRACKNVEKWEASGGCKTSWAGRCTTACKGEGWDRGCCQGTVVGTISSSHCFVGWNVCKCNCNKS